jgi:single-strand DNA-binding protein
LPLTVKETRDMINEAYFSVTGYVATDPKAGYTRDGTRTLSMRVGWTPRRLDRATGDWVDQPSSFISVQCFRRVAENGAFSLRRGDPIVLKGTLRVREYSDQTGAKRISVDVVADTIGHDMSRGISNYARVSASQQQTAAEREAAERDPLPGDRAPALTSAEGDANGAYSALSGPDSALAIGGSADPDLDDRNFEVDADDTFDPEAQTAEVLAESAEPVPALV